MGKVRLEADGTVVEIWPDRTGKVVTPRTDWSRFDATTESEIAAQTAEDEVEALQDAAVTRAVSGTSSASLRSLSRGASVFRSTPCATGNRASARRAGRHGPSYA